MWRRLAGVDAVRAAAPYGARWLPCRGVGHDPVGEWVERFADTGQRARSRPVHTRESHEMAAERRTASLERFRYRPGAAPAPMGGSTLVRRSPKSYPRPLTPRECATLERLARGMTQKMIAFEFGISINTVGNIAANAYRKLGVHGAAAAVHAHRDAHFLCGSRVDFGPVRDRIRASSRLPQVDVFDTDGTRLLLEESQRLG